MNTINDLRQQLETAEARVKKAENLAARWESIAEARLDEWRAIYAKLELISEMAGRMQRAAGASRAEKEKGL